MVGAGGIAERRADAAVLLGDQLFEREVLARRVAPFASRPAVQPLGEGLGQPVGQGLDHDRVVVVELGLEAAHDRIGAEPGGDRERADVVAHAARARGHEVGQAQTRIGVVVRPLLAQHREARGLARARLVSKSTMSSPSLHAGQKP